MTKDEALTLALEALEPLISLSIEPEDLAGIYKAITAIKEALAQPEQETIVWKLVPVEPTEGMLKAMDECSTEGYDERLYAGHAASVYMAAVDAAPTQPTAHRTAGANFCPRCGKRTADLTLVHTCTPPIAADPKAFYGFPSGSVSTPNAGGKCVTAGETAPIDPNQWAFDRGLESS